LENKITHAKELKQIKINRYKNDMEKKKRSCRLISDSPKRVIWKMGVTIPTLKVVFYLIRRKECTMAIRTRG
jgi:hypothetical protein